MSEPEFKLRTTIETTVVWEKFATDDKDKEDRKVFEGKVQTIANFVNEKLPEELLNVIKSL